MLPFYLNPAGIILADVGILETVFIRSGWAYLVK